MLKSMISNVSAGLASGGTVDGDLTITGDFKVEGGGSFAYDEIVEGILQVNATGVSSTALQLIGNSNQLNIELKPSDASPSSYIVGLNSLLSFRPNSTNVLNVSSNSGGRVGIGTSSPSATLEIFKDTASGSDKLFRIYNSSGLQWEIEGDGTMSGYSGNPINNITQIRGAWQSDVAVIGGNSGSESSAGNVIFKTNNTERARLTNTGLIGIGTSSPVSQLHVIGGDGTTARFEESVSGKYAKVDGNSFHASNELYIKAGAVSNDHIYFQNSSSTNMVLLSNGNLGIGTLSPEKILHINDGTYNLQIDGNELFHSDADPFFIKSGGDIKFQPSSTTRFILDNNSRISLSNNDSGSSNTVFGSLIGTIDASSNYNVFIGHGVTQFASFNGVLDSVAIGTASLKNVTTADSSTFVGSGTGLSITTGGNNTGIGRWSHRFNATGTNNTALGAYSMQGVSGNSHSNNTAVGYQSLYAITTGSSNVAIGYQALDAGTTVTSNVAIGGGALGGNVSGNYNTAVGQSSLLTNTNSFMTAVGYNSLRLNSSGAGNVGIGYNAGYGNNTGNFNTHIGYEAGKGVSNNANSDNTSVGYHALKSITTGRSNVSMGREALFSTTTARYQVGIGFKALYSNTAGDLSVAIGQQALYNLDQTSNTHVTAVGNTAGYSITSGKYNSLLGSNAGYSMTTGNDNTIMGYDAGYYNQTGEFNTAIGVEAMRGASGNSHSNNTAVGYNSMYSITTGSNNVAVGSGSLQRNTTGNKAVAIGFNALYQNVTGFGNTAIGSESMQGVSGNSHDYNTGIGYHTLYSVTTGGSNVAIGANALKLLTTGINNLAIGRSALGSATTQSRNIALGYFAGSSITGSDAIYNVLIGDNAGNGGSGNLKSSIAIGYQALDATGSNNVTGAVAIGYQSLTNLTSGANNTAVGYQAGKALTTNGYSTFIGYQAGLVHTGTNNVAIGERAFSDTDAGASSLASTANVAIGSRALGGTLTDASVNGTIAIGNLALGSATMGGIDYNIAIGNESQRFNAGGQNIAIGYNTMRLASSGETSNVAIGSSVMDVLDNAGSDKNVAIGNYSLRGGTGLLARNIAIGHAAMGETRQNNIGGVDNVFIGTEAGGGDWVTATSNYNIGIGSYSLDGAMNGADSNTAIGHSSLSAITTGSNNVAIGYQSSQALSTGSGNTVVGNSAGDALTTGGQNVAIGDAALGAGTTASNNVVIGGRAADAFNGNQNVIIGQTALGTATSTLNSVIVGFAAGGDITTGGSNTLIGTYTDVHSGTASGVICLGFAVTSTANNRVHIGNSTSHIYNDFNSNATWTHSSDERQKKEIKDDTLGLEFINDIRPVTYKHKSPSEFPKEWNAYDENDKEPMGGDKVIHGLIAQEVKQALDKQGVDTFSGWDENPDGRQSVSFEAFVLPLIKAVQELSAEVNELKQQLKDK